MSRMKPEGIQAKDLQLGQQYDIKMGDKNIGRFRVMEKSNGGWFSSAYITLQEVKNNQLMKEHWLNSSGNIVKYSTIITSDEFEKFTAKKA